MNFKLVLIIIMLQSWWCLLQMDCTVWSAFVTVLPPSDSMNHKLYKMHWNFRCRKFITVLKVIWYCVEQTTYSYFEIVSMRWKMKVSFSVFLQGSLHLSALGQKRSLTCYRSWCSATALMWWRSPWSWAGLVTLRRWRCHEPLKHPTVRHTNTHIAISNGFLYRYR